MFCIIEASCGLFATAELLVCTQCTSLIALMSALTVDRFLCNIKLAKVLCINYDSNGKDENTDDDDHYHSDISNNKTVTCVYIGS